MRVAAKSQSLVWQVLLQVRGSCCCLPNTLTSRAQYMRASQNRCPCIYLLATAHCFLYVHVAHSTISERRRSHQIFNVCLRPYNIGRMVSWYTYKERLLGSGRLVKRLKRTIERRCTLVVVANKPISRGYFQALLPEPVYLGIVSWQNKRLSAKVEIKKTWKQLYNDETGQQWKKQNIGRAHYMFMYQIESYDPSSGCLTEWHGLWNSNYKKRNMWYWTGNRYTNRLMHYEQQLKFKAFYVQSN